MTAAQITKLHHDLETRFKDAVKLYSYSKKFLEMFPDTVVLPFNGKKEHDGNLILAQALPMMSPEKQQEDLQRIADRAKARDRQMQPFYDTFKVFLRDFWTGSLLGFDVVKFDEVVKPNKGESSRDAIHRQWGDAGIAIIEDLMR